MFTQLTLRALRAARTPASQPSKYLHPLTSLTRLKTPAPRIASRWLTISTTPRTRTRLPLHLHSNIILPQTTQRTFTSTPRSSFRTPTKSNYQYQSRPNYNRFGGGGGGGGSQRGSIFLTLLHKSKPQHFVILGIGISGIYLYNTDVVEMTGRRRFNCVSAERELAMGAESYREILASERGKVLPDYHPLTKSVDRILQRLIPMADIEGAEWKVHVIKDDGMANAFVLPGGKVFVYTGILPICQDEDGLAAVLGHEIAHVVARHPAERMSTSVLTMGTIFLVSMLFDVSGQLSSMLVNLMWSLPNSRTQEAEADNIGLMMMSKACFNPEAAVKLWHRMQQQEKGAPPQFMSTHPSSYNREEAIRGWLEKAEMIYQDNDCGSIGKYMPSFQNAIRSHGSAVW
ncbi:hypothetical protein N7481_006396 [Penicillium waksmanii]|uniref:uncharacterized protein n=1 Tax=Penicillium waksmanii TaxID=69791 RepID=UPI002548948E|nr:uncharacterized protein N7481_006396 [Penicillium waksmanii]KAJ5984297.1 hypothetical protein N7481_006396 [Penicillium waksmanii]